MSYQEFKKDLLKDPEFRKEYNKKDLKFEMSFMIQEARAYKGITQKELAKKMDTKQESISRIENGNHIPSLDFLQKMAKALGTELIFPKFAFLEDQEESFDFYTQNSMVIDRETNKTVNYDTRPACLINVN